MFEGYVEFGGQELINNARSIAYTDTVDCSINWLRCPPCDGVHDAVSEDVVYDYANIEDAPWYDAEVEATHRFLGITGLTIEGLPGGTREATVQEGVGDGGVVGQVRRATRRMRVEAMLSAKGEDALEAGFSWLHAALSPGRCGVHGTRCGATDMRFFTACPPLRSDYVTNETIWNDPITNKARNPSMETAAGTVVVANNLVTNPSFEASGPAVLVRTNFAQVPRGSGLVAGNGQLGVFAGRTYGTGGAGNYQTVLGAVDGPVGGPNQYVRKTWTTAATANVNAGIDLTTPPSAGVATNGFAVVAGTQQTLSVYVRSSAAGKIMHLQLYYHDAAGAFTTQVDGPDVALTAGAWTRLTLTTTHPAGAATVGIAADVDSGTPWALNDTLDATGTQLETNTAASPYFDGLTPAGNDFTYAWVGTANASPSLQNGVEAIATDGDAYTGARAVRSTGWSSSGAASLRIIASGPGGSANAAARLLDHTAFVVGRTYTIIAKVRLTAPLTGGGEAGGAALARRIRLSAATTQISPQVPNVAGVHEIRWTVTIPDTVNHFQLWHGGSQGSPDIWWDDVMVVEGTYTGLYFDGARPRKPLRNRVGNPSTVSSGLAYTMTGGKIVTYDTGYARATSDGTGTFYMYPSVAAGENAAYGGTGYSVTPGESITTRVRVRNNNVTPQKYSMGHINYSVNAGSGGDLISPQLTLQPGETGVIEWTTTVPTTPAGITGVIPILYWVNYANGTRGTAPLGTTLDSTEWAVYRGPVPSPIPFISGAIGYAPYASAWEGVANQSASYVYDPDFTVQWAGTVNGSASSLMGTGVADILGSSSASVQSTAWAAVGTKSVRVVAGGVGTSPAAVVQGLALQPSRIYTALARIRFLTAGGAGTFARQIVFSQNVGPDQASVAATNVPGEYWVRLVFTTDVALTTYSLYLGGSGDLSGEVWWDALTVVEGSYQGPYFDGDGIDSVNPPIEYAWTGTPHASTSTGRTGQIIQVPDPVSYAAAVDVMVRNIHTVTCVSGPTIIQKFHRGEAWGYQLEFVLVAGVPYVFGNTNQIDVAPTLPVIIQDVPFNLVPYPSAELALPTPVTIATNYSDNPSVELNATHWAAGSTVVLPANVSGAQSALLFSAGTKSWRTRFVATNAAATPATLTAENVSATFAATASGARMSFNMWAVAQIESGTAVIQKLEVWAIFSGGTSVLVGTPPVAGGGAVSSKGVAVPTGTTSVTLQARATLSSWNTGVVINLYADAVAVTVP